MTSELDFFLYPEKLFFDSFKPTVDLFFSREKDYPVYDIFKEDDGSSTIEIALAGYPKENVSVKTEKNMLVISSDKVEPSKERKGYTRMAKRAFSKCFRDPYGMFDLSNVKAVLKDGILSVNVPLKQEAKSKEIVINVE